MYRLLNDNRESLGIMEYSVSESSLEQIFMSFARTQDEELADAPSLAPLPLDSAVSSALTAVPPSSSSVLHVHDVDASLRTPLSPRSNNGGRNMTITMDAHMDPSRHHMHGYQSAAAGNHVQQQQRTGRPQH